jgi:flavorubredoxin
MAVELTPEVDWINECYELDDENDGRNLHLHVSVYVIDGSVVVDSGSFHHRQEILSGIREVVDENGDDDGIEALVLSHTDYPHSANVGAVAEEWDDVEVVSSAGEPSIQGLPKSSVVCDVGQTAEVAGRTLAFVDPPLADRSHTMWIHDVESGVLFTADGFGNRHLPGECDLTSAESDDRISFDDVLRHHEETLAWLRYVDVEALRDAVESVFEEHDVEWVAPIHGNPIERDDFDDYLEKLFEAASRVAE